MFFRVSESLTDKASIRARNRKAPKLACCTFIYTRIGLVVGKCSGLQSYSWCKNDWDLSIGTRGSAAWASAFQSRS